MKNKLLIIGFSLFIFSCENDMEKLRGHWHIYEKNQQGYFNTNEYYTIDIIDSNLVFFQKYNRFPFDFIGFVDAKENTILLRGEDNILDFNYEWKNDSLFLAQMYYEGVFFAEKCEEGCCDKQNDFFSETGQDIDLPAIRDTSIAIVWEELSQSLEIPILIGVPKIERHKIPTLKLDDKFASADDIKTWFEIVKQTIPIKSRDKMFFTLFANKAIDFKELFETINELKKLDINFIYLALREENAKEKFKVWRKKVNLNDPNLKTIIENHYDDFWEN